MNDGYLKLTSWFSERDRAGGVLRADALLDLYARAGIETSLVLRGNEGFGLEHSLRTDLVLSLSEDLPVVVIAVDRRERIEALLGEARAIGEGGLLTLERLRAVGHGSEPIELPAELAEAAKLTAWIGRQERIGRRPAFVAICEMLQRHGVSGASVLLGIDGTERGERRRAGFLSRNARVPMTVVAVGRGAAIAAAASELRGTFERPLLTLERARICVRDGELLGRPHALPPSDAAGLPIWQQLTVYTSEAARHEGHSIHAEVVRRLRAAGVGGATSVRGIWGFHGDGVPHGDRLLALRRRVPIVTTAIDEPARIAAAFDDVRELTAEHGLVTAEMVPALRAVASRGSRGALDLANHSY